MRKPALPPSAFLQDMADARLENTRPLAAEAEAEEEEVAVCCSRCRRHARFAPALRTLPTAQCSSAGR
jgi:hypothetical protein